MIYFLILLPLFAGILYVWFGTTGMLKERRIAPFLVLIIYGISYMLLAALNQFQLFGTTIHAIEASTHATAITLFALTYGALVMKLPARSAGPGSLLL
ncbi:hypothetical protein A3C89_04145 [Candidatus Kaiserbacteria bacterium RIFCSPHIGHO2_02_FULL_50_50]|uniref:Uncharacterized protein n=1 Tax=Candidatus Kaiserbacteria bacterium RIFCSPHIGHO2_02_FULL_50_50 TaxID=1798492 RepID=A0A1F6DCZ6_9BACT|nr:MAG: hypothetical protein A3C89_04145 [Candidatus Kaiserbacteria bacterium RIFCSPHIGHO2_02_FULL_50_50]OGG88961.1 MAG: hypothetical protein A3G62_02360 [Candidatus Kaiserbacteria bacterium RIFCSPLOWO2_12_FULL_50_10]